MPGYTPPVQILEGNFSTYAKLVGIDRAGNDDDNYRLAHFDEKNDVVYLYDPDSFTVSIKKISTLAYASGSAPVNMPSSPYTTAGAQALSISASGRSRYFCFLDSDATPDTLRIFKNGVLLQSIVPADIGETFTFFGAIMSWSGKHIVIFPDRAARLVVLRGS